MAEIHISKFKSLSQLKFDDEIIGEVTKAQYTHHVNGTPQFLLSIKRNDKWICDGVFADGLKSALSIIKDRDLKYFYNDTNFNK